jgi:hypothetical protein
MTAKKATANTTFEPQVVPTELYFDGIEATMMGAANSQLRFFVLKNEKRIQEEKQIVTLPTLSLVQFCLSTLVKMKEVKTELENEDKNFFQALEFTEKRPDEMALPEIKNIGRFVGKLSKPKKMSIINCDD